MFILVPRIGVQLNDQFLINARYINFYYYIIRTSKYYTYKFQYIVIYYLFYLKSESNFTSQFNNNSIQSNLQF